LIALIVIFATVVPSGYYIIGPGGTYEIEPRLHLPPEARQEMGRLAFTAVYAKPGNWLEFIQAKLSPAEEAVPVSEVRPRGISQQELNEINQRLIEESKEIAAVVGLRAAGYDTSVTGQGALVVGTLEGLPAEAVLQPGDTVLAADGQPIETASQLVEAIQRREVGAPVELLIDRGGQRLKVIVNTVSSPTEPGRPIVGASVSTRGFDVRLPFPVQFDTTNIGGPSAGLMFSLGVLDGVTDGDLTRGNFVAGTGTIAADGSVGPISGAAQKVIAAQRDGADLFLVPRDNYDEARTTAGSLPLVPVESFDQALRALCGLEPRDGSANPPGPPCPVT
jgi:PDZ domain-containing protein